MEDENRVFGDSAESFDNLDSEEDFVFYQKDKEKAKKDIDKSAKDFADFMDSISADVPELSQEEINKGIENILKKANPDKTQSEPEKNKRIKLKVLFLVALIALISVSALFAVGNSNNISIENGFVSFAKDTVKIVFFGDDNEKYIPVDILLNDLEQHGYKDILFPEEFVLNQSKYKASVPKYFSDKVEQISFYIYDDTTTYAYAILKQSNDQHANDYVDLNNAETFLINGVYIYLFNYDNNNSTIEFVHDGCSYLISSKAPYSDMVKIAESIKQS